MTADEAAFRALTRKISREVVGDSLDVVIESELERVRMPVNGLVDDVLIALRIRVSGRKVIPSDSNHRRTGLLNNCLW